MTRNMKQVIVRNPNPIRRKCQCGREYELTMWNREYRCSCGLHTLYVPHTAKGYYAIAGDFIPKEINMADEAAQLTLDEQLIASTYEEEEDHADDQSNEPEPAP